MRAALLAACLAVWTGLAGSAAAQPRQGGVRWPAFTSATGPLPTAQVQSLPDLRIGSAAGADYSLLHGIAGAVRLSGGGVAIADAGKFRVVFFDQRGRFTHTVGRPGDGPGEYRLPRWFGRCADGTMAVHDGSHARLTFLDAKGAVDTTVTLPAGANFDQLLWCARSGRVLMLLNRPRGPARPGARTLVPTTLIAAQGTGVDTLGRPGDQEYYIGRAVQALTTVPLGRATLAVAGRRLVYACDNQEASCQALDTAGVTHGQFRIPLAAVAMTAAHWAAALGTHFAGDPTRSFRSTGERLLKEIRPPSKLPLIDQVRVDHEENLWVRTLDNYGSAVATWVILSPTGRPIGLVATPRALQVTEIGPGHILGVAEDQDGVEYVELYRFARPGG